MPGEPLPQADPADIAEQVTPVDDSAEYDVETDVPLETDPADFQEQQQIVPDDEDYPGDYGG
jgi:hypothetical protein